jgi:hypothetical protein
LLAALGKGAGGGAVSRHCIGGIAGWCGFSHRRIRLMTRTIDGMLMGGALWVALSGKALCETCVSLHHDTGSRRSRNQSAM